ncbi:hypothetical protein, partial [Streptomyces rameus]|uniref:hypothetical protein n=1 Tax=Streptomyces rameus TaxID=68261 RepID=UPI003CD0A715
MGTRYGARAVQPRPPFLVPPLSPVSAVPPVSLVAAVAAVAVVAAAESGAGRKPLLARVPAVFRPRPGRVPPA